MKKKKYQSEALMVAHMMMEDLYELGAISAERMREFDEGCLVSEPAPDTAAYSDTIVSSDTVVSEDATASGSRRAVSRRKAAAPAPAGTGRGTPAVPAYAGPKA